MRPKKRKVQMGRPPLPEDQVLTQIAVRLPKRMLATIEAIAAARLDQPDRSAVVRELLAEALQAREKAGRRVR